MTANQSLNRKLLSLFLSVLFLAVGWFLFRSEWHQLEKLHWHQAPWLIAAILVRWLRTALRCRLQQSIIRNDGVRIPYLEMLSLGFATTLTNGVLPLKSGSALSAVFLKKRYHYSFQSYVGVILGVNVLFTLIALIIGCLAASALWFLGSTPNPNLGIITLALIFLLVGAIALLGYGKKIKQLPPQIHRILSGWTELWQKKEVWRPATSIAIISTALSGLSLALAFKAFGIRLDLLGTALLMCSQNLGNLISLTPGSFGFKEAFGAYFATTLGITSAQTVFVLLIFRLSGLLSYLLPGLASFFSLSRKLKDPSAR